MTSEIWTEKYRPSKFSEIVGQDEIVKRVEALVKSVNIPHILFAGPAGTGKTYLAMAKAVNLLMTKAVRRIILTRPAIEAGESLPLIFNVAPLTSADAVKITESILYSTDKE